MQTKTRDQLASEAASILVGQWASPMVERHMVEQLIADIETFQRQLEAIGDKGGNYEPEDRVLDYLRWRLRVLSKEQGT
jgi:cell division FtsZ-interacting protein ZapD